MLVKREIIAILLMLGGILSAFGSLVMIAWIGWDLAVYHIMLIDKAKIPEYRFCTPFFAFCWYYHNWSGAFDFFYALSLTMLFFSLFVAVIGAYYLGKIRE